MSLDPICPALDPNPVWRSYRGGRILRTFRGQPDTADDHFPEDWLASTVLARNGKNSQGVTEGLSRISDANSSLLVESLKQRPEFWFGPSQGAHERPSARGVCYGNYWIPRCAFNSRRILMPGSPASISIPMPARPSVGISSARAAKRMFISVSNIRPLAKRGRA